MVDCVAVQTVDAHKFLTLLCWKITILWDSDFFFAKKYNTRPSYMRALAAVTKIRT